ncbi:MAG: 50S ribosomal protein L10 [Candidatus Falkowbacteria bacterium]|nr:50S ribosomal protein L10 [Candidatus Falkowbacteria bacterium]
MPKTKGQKKAIIDELTAKLSAAKSLVFLNFDKMTVVENEELRKELKKENSEYIVSKKTLLGISLKNNDIGLVDLTLTKGQFAAVLGYEDVVAPAKILAKFIKSHPKKIEFIGGILDNKYINAIEVQALAKLPSKQELYASIVGSLNAPISGFVNALAGNLKNLVYVLKAIEEKK